MWYYTPISFHRAEASDGGARQWLRQRHHAHFTINMTLKLILRKQSYIMSLYICWSPMCSVSGRLSFCSFFTTNNVWVILYYKIRYYNPVKIRGSFKQLSYSRNPLSAERRRTIGLDPQYLRQYTNKCNLSATSDTEQPLQHQEGPLPFLEMTSHSKEMLLMSPQGGSKNSIVL